MRSRLQTEAFLRRAYSLQGDLEQWCDGIAEILEPSFPPGLAFQTAVAHIDHDSRDLKVLACPTRGGERDSELRSLFHQAPQLGMGKRVYSGVSRVSYTTVTQAGLWTPEGLDVFRAAGVQDYLMVVGASPHVVISLGTLQARVLPRAPGSGSAWLRVCRHMHAGFRARLLLENATALNECDAVLDPSGRLLEARGSARSPGVRERLRCAVLARERSRDWRALGEVESLERWGELVGGGWLLVDHFESNGRRYVLAVRSDQDSADLRTLSRSEALALEGAALGQPYKAMAAQLDVSLARVHQLVATGLAKLGLADAADLVSCARSRGAKQLALWPIGDGTLAALRYPAASADAMVGLSVAECSVVAGLLGGHSYSQIAAVRGRSLRTVANQAASAYRKLGVGSRLELVARFAAQRSPSLRKSAAAKREKR